MSLVTRHPRVIWFNEGLGERFMGSVAGGKRGLGFRGREKERQKQRVVSSASSHV